MIRDCRQDVMDPHIHALNNLEHAHWKVNFIRHLLQAHLASPWKGTREWQAQHAEYLHRLATAEDELAICERAPAILQKGVEGTRVSSGARERQSTHAHQSRRHESNPAMTKPDSP
jgi:hypothetical protein